MTGEQPPKVIYIAGVGHSGSTLLSLMLGQHSRMIGLGEIAGVLKESEVTGLDYTQNKGVLCSCGKPLDKCEFWREVARTIRERRVDSFVDRYRIMLDTAGEMYGHDHIVVDSTKNLPQLRSLVESGKISGIKVIHFIKDVRAYTVSGMDRLNVLKARGMTIKKRKKNLLAPFLMHFSAYYYLSWYRMNRKTYRYLRENDIPFLQMGYEELCLRPRISVERLCEFIGIESEDSMLSLSSVESNHILRGNRMRATAKDDQISYDIRWFQRNEWIVPSLIFPHVSKFNRTEVYSNSSDRLSK